MFSLIITIVSIALVAALALATLYYGGSAYDQASGQARASTIVNQGQQLLGASELFFAQRGAWPTSVDELVSEGFLKDVPVVQSPVGQALAAQTWTMPMAGQPVFVLQTETTGACRGVNEKVYGMDGILPRIQAGVVMQCYGTSPALTTMYSVAGRNAEHLMEVARSGLAPFGEADVSTDPIPSADDALWLLKPGEKFAGVGTGGGTTPEPEPVLPGEYELLAFQGFGAVPTNTTEQRTLTIRNKGQGPLALSMPPVLSNTTLFSLAGNTCAASLAPADTCEITIAYAPTAVSGQDQTTLSFGHGDPSVTAEIVLQASAFNPVSLQSSQIPPGKLNRAYNPFNFASLLSVSNEQTPDLQAVTWSVNGTLPAGMSFNTTTGQLSGTPTALANQAPFTVTAAYKLNNGQQAYTISVGEATLVVTALETGSAFTCAITEGGVVKCWGDNANGQIGQGNTTDYLLPVAVQDLPAGMEQITAGFNTACASKANQVWCWGAGFTGKATLQQTFSSNVLRITRGNAHTCVALQSGGAQCWGTGTSGELGNGVAANSATPVNVSLGGRTVTHIKAGYYHTCAVADGGAWCWGAGGQGRLGNGVTTQQNSPTQVSELSNGVVQVTAAESHSCALLSTKTVRCWGGQASGKLGNGTTVSANITTPVAVTGANNANIVQVSAGQGATCMVNELGQVFCFGSKSNGQLGDGQTSGATGTPVQVIGVSGASYVSVGSNYPTVCAATSAGTKCWGEGSQGSMGNGTTTGTNATAVTVSD